MDLLACRICLKMNLKMYKYDRFDLNSHYEHITGYRINNCDSMPHYFCYLCASLLQRYDKFAEKCHISFTILQEIVDMNEKVSQHHIACIDRKSTKIDLDYYYAVKNQPHIEINPEISSQTEAESYFEKCDILINPTIEDVKSEPEDFDNDTTFASNLESNNQNTDKINDKLLVENIFKSDISIESAQNVNIEPKIVKKRGRPPKKLKLSKEINVRKKLGRPPNSKKKKEKIVRKCKPKSNKPNSKVIVERKKAADYLLERTTMKMFTPPETVEHFLKRKEARSFFAKAHRCDLCYKGFGSHEAYGKHMDLCHDPARGAFECALCGHRLRTRNIMRRHWMNVHARMYTCNACKHVTYTGAQALEHQRFKHGNEKYECRHCGETLRTRSTYYMHLRTAHPNIGTACDICGDFFEGLPGLNKHRKLKHLAMDTLNEKEPSFHCQLCDTGLQTKKGYISHMMKLHHKHGCSICQQLFESQADVDSHECVQSNMINSNPLNKTKVNNGMFMCYQCGTYFVSESALNVHKTSAHNAQGGRRARRTYQCDQCDAHFTSKPDIERHWRYHAGQLMFQCRYCQQEFVRKRELEEHTQSVHAGNLPYLCSHCGRAYAKEVELVRHMRHLERKCHCSMCGMYFASEEETKAHKNSVHPGKLPFSCATCGKSFSSSGAYYYHISSMHEVGNAYGCSRCGKKYRSNSSLRLHMITVHMKLPDPYHRHENRPVNVKQVGFTSVT